MALRVLQVDDDRVNALLFEETCRVVGGIEVETAGSGAEALAIAAALRPALLVIDLHLPDTDGCALLAALRALPGLAAATAFLCSADEGAAIERRARDAGFAGCWTKPVAPPTLRAERERLAAGLEAAA